MSLFGTLNTAVSGMAAQANYLGTISDNIANSSTTGYKSANTYFETMLGNQTPSTYTSGGVQTLTRYSISDQGTISGTSSVTDLAINGSGFFVVQGANNATALTRAGSFVPDANGDLVNTAGYKLMGYNLTDGSSASANGTAGLEVVNISKDQLSATPSSSGTLNFNVPSTAAIVTGNTPASDGSNPTYSANTTLTAYDNLGNPVTLDVYLTKTADSNGTATWQATTYNHADAASGGSFPYTPSTPLSNQTLTYSDATGKLTAVDGNTSPLSLSVPIPNGNTVALDLSSSTQLASAFNVSTANVDGNAPSTLSSVAIGTDGTVTANYASGQSKAIYKIPLADVPSETNLTPLDGNVYEPSPGSGDMIIGSAQSGSLGAIDSSSLESSDVDLATQLTDMISAQRSYEANSKVIQASSDLLKIVDQLNG